MAETVAEVLARIRETMRRLQLRSTAEPDTADEDETDAGPPTQDTATPE